MKRLAVWLLPAVDLLLLPVVYLSAFLLKNVRRVGIHRMPLFKSAFMRVGVFPVRNHYYEPQFDHRNARKAFSQDRFLPGIDWNVPGQLEMLDRFSFADELADVPAQKTSSLEFYLSNGYFGAGDAEYWYQMIRATKPKRILEVGCGHSTLMAIQAIRANKAQEPTYDCKHLCIEPYEVPWLETTGVIVLREKVEDVDIEIFRELRENDILFVDSSHMIRPQGDVLFEYLEVLPSLAKGVVVHFHDIFSPKNYPSFWLEGEVRFWNEQYLLEAFLSNNHSWKIVGALNYLSHHHYERLKSIAPFLDSAGTGGPGSFYIQRRV